MGRLGEHITLITWVMHSFIHSFIHGCAWCSCVPGVVRCWRPSPLKKPSLGLHEVYGLMAEKGSHR